MLCYTSFHHSTGPDPTKVSEWENHQIEKLEIWSGSPSTQQLGLQDSQSGNLLCTSANHTNRSGARWVGKVSDLAMFGVSAQSDLHC